MRKIVLRTQSILKSEYERNFLRAFVEQLRKERHGMSVRFEDTNENDLAQDGFLKFGSEILPVELVDVTNKQRELSADKFVRMIEQNTDPASVLDSDFGVVPLNFQESIESSLKSKFDKKYSDAASRVLVINACASSNFPDEVANVKLSPEFIDAFRALYIFCPWTPKSLWKIFKPLL